MAPLGLLGGPVPEKYGGIGRDFVSHALVTEGVGRADSSVRTTLSVQISLVEMTILKFGTEEQKQRWLPSLCKGEIIGCFGLTEPEVCSDGTTLRTTAKRDDAQDIRKADRGTSARAGADRRHGRRDRGSAAPGVARGRSQGQGTAKHPRDEHRQALRVRGRATRR